MTLDILENSESIEFADGDLFNLLFKHSKNFGKVNVIYEFYNGSKLQNFSEESDIYCLKENNIWFSHIQKSGRIFYAFGVDIPKNDDLNTPICVIDFSIKGVNRNTLTTFAVDDSSNIYVLVRLNYNQLRDSFNSFLLISERIQALEVDKKYYFINLGQLNLPNFLEMFTKFVDEMGNIKTSNSESNTESNVDNEDMNKKSCVLCSKKFSKIDLKFDSCFNDLIKDNPDKCIDCLEKIYAGMAIIEIKKIIAVSFFNEDTLLDKVDNKLKFQSYLQILKKQDIIKIRKFGNNDFCMFNRDIDLDEFTNIYTKIGKRIN